MDPLWAKAAVLTASVVLVAIRAPHGHRSRGIRIVRSRKGGREKALLTLAWISFFLPLAWVFVPGPWPGDYLLRPLPFGAGVALYAAGLRLFHLSHADLGTNWSISLDLREGHRLVTGGLYHRVRHPMYLALLLHAAGQALALPNAAAGPSYLVAMAAIVALRLRPEERMLREAFGRDWEEYAARTKRLLPGIW